ncbi:Crp/Fnr family transcriptional regulator [Mariniflexile aquimaris]|uniref:Crp/Fnr family transcriptional regulator n=1 Tax=Mariniflexile aquimaris TaxID=881009 RepID=A0ABW3BSJ2_9FLAO
MNDQELFLKEKITKYYSNILEEELIDEMVKVSHYNKIPSGELMIDIGDEMTHIPLILDGIVKIMRKDDNGEEIVLHFLERGDTCAISFANCINKKRSIFRGIIEKDLEAIFLPVDSIDIWLSKFKSFRHFIIDSYHFRLLEMVDTIDGLAFMNLGERILKYLADKAKVNNTNDLDITHLDIANDLNTSRVVISRIVKQLHDENKIYSTRNKIRVLIPEK